MDAFQSIASMHPSSIPLIRLGGLGGKAPTGHWVVQKYLIDNTESLGLYWVYRYEVTNLSRRFGEKLGKDT